MSKVNIIFVFIKTSSEDEDERRLQDAFKTSSSRRMFAGMIHAKHTQTFLLPPGIKGLKPFLTHSIH